MRTQHIHLRRSRTLRAAIALLLAVANASFAAVLVASKDTYIQGAVNNAGKNNGTSTGIFAQDFSRNSSFLTFLSFDLSSYTPGTFLSATLQLTATSTQSGFGYTFSIFGLKDSQNADGWGETTLTYNSAISAGNLGITYNAANSYISQDIDPNQTDLLGTAVQVSKNNSLTFSVANLLSFLNQDTDGMVTFLLAANGPYGGNPSLQWNSREFATASLRPTLLVTAIPEPSTLLLIGLGGALLFLRRCVRPKQPSFSCFPGKFLRRNVEHPLAGSLKETKITKRFPVHTNLPFRKAEITWSRWGM